MKSNPTHPPPRKQGFILFYAMGILAVLSLFALIALNSAGLESRTASNHYDVTRALYHAEAGTKLVKQRIESGLRNGESLSSILSTLSVSAPQGLEFDTIDTFNMIVPERLFSFESVGRSGDAVSRVVVQYRRRPMMSMGLFGNLSIDAQNHVSLYGYDSRLVENPTPADNNGGASIGSNGGITLGNNNFTFDGQILLGETGSGLIASCTNCDSEDYTKLQIGAVDEDPLGLLSGGTMSQIFTTVQSQNNNTQAGILNNSISVPSQGEFTLTAGDYYLSEVYVGPNATLTIDASDGPVRLFLDGEFRMQPNTSNLILSESASPQDFQIYSKSTEDIRLQPMGDLSAYIYAPQARVVMLPMGDFRGNVWADQIRIQPMGNIYLDTSIAEMMLMNNLEIHAWYEQQGV